MPHRFTRVPDIPGWTVTGTLWDPDMSGGAGTGLGRPMSEQSGWDPAIMGIAITGDTGGGRSASLTVAQ